MSPPAAEPSPLQVRCAWCRRVHGAAGWCVPDEEPDPQLVTHGICLSCRVDLETRGKSRLTLHIARD